MPEKSNYVKWGSQPVYSIKNTAFFLNTAPANVTALIDLGMIKFIKLKSKEIPQFEIERFIQDNLGKDLSELIDQQQEIKQAEKEGRTVLPMN